MQERSWTRAASESCGKPTLNPPLDSVQPPSLSLFFSLILLTLHSHRLSPGAVTETSAAAGEAAQPQHPPPTYGTCPLASLGHYCGLLFQDTEDTGGWMS